MSESEVRSEEEISLLALASILLRWRRPILALGVGGAALGLALGLSTPRAYVASATFLPQTSEATPSGLAAAASQLGIRMPASGSSWGPPVYAELLRSRALLEPIAVDSVRVLEEGGRKLAVINLLGVKENNHERQVEYTLRILSQTVKTDELKEIGAVRVTVTTKWPSVSLALAQRLITGVNQFILETRKSQATAERQFVEARAAEAEGTLRDAEDRLQSFMQRNRTIAGSPELGLDRDRLQRDVALRQQLYTTLLQSREEARIREVRDMPVITMLEVPRLPAAPESRKVLVKGVLGGVTGVLLGVLLAFFAQAVTGALRTPSADAREFVQLVEEARPRFFKHAEGG